MSITRAHGPRSLLLGVLLVALLASGQVVAGAQPQRPAPEGSDPFTPGAAYGGDFPDPTVMRVGARYYAAATTVAGVSLPLMTSTDLRSWTTRAAHDPARPNRNDGLPTPPAWAEQKTTPAGRTFVGSWAPSVARTRSGYVAAYSVPRAGDGRRCISLARSTSPMGPFVDSSTTALICAQGVIDPQVFVDRRATWLLFKVVGLQQGMYVKKLNANLTGFAPGARLYPLLRPRMAWEGGVVENPAMIRYRKRLYLFYSGNDWTTSRYATGYAVCKRVTGPCKRKGVLLATGRYVAGPGGATPFLDTAGRLRAAFHAWRADNVGYPVDDSCRATDRGCAQRRMHIAHLVPGKRGRLRLGSWF